MAPGTSAPQSHSGRNNQASFQNIQPSNLHQIAYLERLNRIVPHGWLRQYHWADDDKLRSFDTGWMRSHDYDCSKTALGGITPKHRWAMPAKLYFYSPSKRARLLRRTALMIHGLSGYLRKYESKNETLRFLIDDEDRGVELFYNFVVSWKKIINSSLRAPNTKIINGTLLS